MFTGIIEEIGSIKKISSRGQTLLIEIVAKTVLTDAKIGDSIAVNGVCLTITALQSNSFTADVMPATFKNTNLSQLSQNSKVNLERAMSVNSRFGGHMVSGHIDETIKIIKKETEQNAMLITLAAPSQISDKCLVKGSICLDGTSLTIMDTADNWLKVSLIPHTQQKTILAQKNVGESVNIEYDMLLKAHKKTVKSDSLSYNFLKEHGFA